MSFFKWKDSHWRWLRVAEICNILWYKRRSQWPRGLRRRSTAARLLRSWVRILAGAWISVCFECCVLSGRDLCDGLNTRPEESYWLWCVVVCDQENNPREWGGQGPLGGYRVKRKIIWYNMPRIFPGSEGSRCLRLITSPPSCAECRGTLRA